MKKLLYIVALAVSISACKKSNEEATPVSGAEPKQVFTDFSNSIVINNLKDLKANAQTLDLAIEQFINSPSETTLSAAQQKWYSTRISWEQSEAFLFGPVATKELDPAIDSWPVNFVDIDSLINNETAFSDAFMDSLNPNLKGFHPIEYLLFGTNKSRKYNDLTPKQITYLGALAKHLSRITTQMLWEWDVAGGNYGNLVVTAGDASNTEFPTQKEAMLTIASGLLDIVEEVGDGKIGEPFVAKDATLEESPFAMNSWADFTNNMIGVRNVYTGKYSTQATGLSNWVSVHNKSLDARIRQKIDAVVANLQAHTTPFGQAITSNPSGVSATQQVLSDLKTVLEGELIPLIQQKL